MSEVNDVTLVFSSVKSPKRQKTSLLCHNDMKFYFDVTF